MEPYNHVLAMNQMIENADIVIPIDNGSLFRIACDKLKTASPGYTDMNRFVTQTLSGITSSMRFPAHMNMDLRKLSVNLTPFPRLHFFVPSEAPIVDTALAQFDVRTNTLDSFNDAIRSLTESKAALVDCDLELGRFISATACFRGGDTSLFDAYQILSTIKSNESDRFVHWMPSNWNYTFASRGPANLAASATLVSNNTSVQTLFKRVLDAYHLLFDRKAFLHWFTGEGMDEMEFVEAAANVSDLVAEYQQYSGVDEEFADDDGTAD